jgi:hypothetical protein
LLQRSVEPAVKSRPAVAQFRLRRLAHNLSPNRGIIYLAVRLASRRSPELHPCGSEPFRHGARRRWRDTLESHSDGPSLIDLAEIRVNTTGSRFAAGLN